MAPGNAAIGRAVYMHIPKPRHKKPAGAVDDDSAFGNVRLFRRTYRDDMITLHNYSPIRLWGAPVASITVTCRIASDWGHPQILASASSRMVVMSSGRRVRVASK